MNHTASSQYPQFSSVNEFLGYQRGVTTSFFMSKIGRAAKRLFELGESQPEIAKLLDLPSSDAVFIMIKHWGKK